MDSKVLWAGAILVLSLERATWAEMDFCPLKLGNRWVYHGTGADAPFTPYTYTDDRTMEVQSAIPEGEGIRYRVQVANAKGWWIGSNPSSPIKLDTFWVEIVDGPNQEFRIAATSKGEISSLDSCFFRSRYYPDSVPSKREFGDTTHDVVSVTNGFWRYQVAAGLGMIHFSQPNRSVQDHVYILKEFNGQPIATSIVRHPAAAVSRNSGLKGNSGYRDALGRRVEDPAHKSLSGATLNFPF